MKQIDLKSFLIGFLLCAVTFLSMGQSSGGPTQVRIVGINKGSFESWDAIRVAK